MAITTTTVKNQVLADSLMQAVVDTLTNQSEFYRLLLTYGAVIPASSAKGIEWKAQVSGHSNVVPFADEDPAPASSQAATVDAFLPWGQYQGTIEISQLAEKQLDSPLSGKEISNFWEMQVESLATRFRVVTDTGMRGGTVVNGIVGNNTAVAIGGTYATIDRAVYTTLNAYVLTAGAALTEVHLDTVYLNLTDTNGGSANIIVGSQTVVNAMKGFDSITQNISKADLGTPIQGQFGVGSFFRRLVPQFYYKDIPVVAISGWTAGRLDFFDLGNPEGPMLEIFQGITLEDLGATSTMRRKLATMYMQYRVKNPKKTTAAIITIG